MDIACRLSTTTSLLLHINLLIVNKHIERESWIQQYLLRHTITICYFVALLPFIKHITPASQKIIIIIIILIVTIHTVTKT